MIPCNRMKTIISLLLLLAVVKLIHCQDHEQMIVLTLQGILQNLESINGQLKDMQEKFQHLENNLQDVQQELGNQKTNFQELHHELEHVKGLSQETGQLLRREVLEHLTNVSAAANEEIKSYVHEEISGVISLAQGHDELLQRIPDMQEKFQHLENNLQDVQQELGNQKTNFQELHHELEHVKGLSQETGQLLRREVLEHLTNVSAAANEEIKSYVHEEISGVISLAQGHDELLQRIPDMQEKLQHLENNLQDVQQEQGNQKTYFQELHHELEHVKGLSRETAQCLKGEDLEHLTNVSAAANQEIKSFHEEMSEVIAWSRKDKCSEGSLLCGKSRTCKNNPFSFTCSCPSGFTWDGSECEDVDECAEGKDECVPNATCKNSIGSYSCSCNKPFKGDGKTSCEFQCKSPAKMITGLGCLMAIEQWLPFNNVKDVCEEEGGRLAQHMSLQQLQNMVVSFGFGWVGVYDGKWMSDGSLVPEDLWVEGYRSDPSWLCGYVVRDSSSSTFKLDQRDCSEKHWGYCQFPMP
ncbi:uncharacterized protein [Palaemon carinicauda]|uniref:uncharacterized protein n=1 Tax=Palaemon carinicauda TaxID=392227 RepID=UPI0035B5F369